MSTEPHRENVREYRKTATVLAGQAPTAGTIPTLEGDHTYEAGDYIAGPGQAGEFWPVKRTIFEATYEPLDAARAAQDDPGWDLDGADPRDVARAAQDVAGRDYVNDDPANILGRRSVRQPVTPPPDALREALDGLDDFITETRLEADLLGRLKRLRAQGVAPDALREAAQDIITNFARDPGWTLEHDSEETATLRAALRAQGVVQYGETLDVERLARALVGPLEHDLGYMPWDEQKPEGWRWTSLAADIAAAYLSPIDEGRDPEVRDAV